MALSSSPQALPESEKKSFSVASLVQSVKNGYHKVMDCVKDQVPSFDRKTLVLLGALATPTAMANTPPSWAPLIPIASSVMTSPSRAPADELDKTLADIFPSYTMPESPLASPLASENQAWSLFPVQEIRDIGADEIAPIVVATKNTEHHNGSVQKKQDPRGDIRENEFHGGRLTPDHGTEREALRKALQNLGKFRPEVREWLKIFAHNIAPHAKVSFVVENGPNNVKSHGEKSYGPSGVEKLQQIANVSKLSMDETFEPALIKIFEAELAEPTLIESQKYVKNLITGFRNLNDAIAKAEKEKNPSGNLDNNTAHSPFQWSVVDDFNHQLQSLENPTAQDIRRLFDKSYKMAVSRYAEPDLQQASAPLVLKATQRTVSSPMLVMHIVPHPGETGVKEQKIAIPSNTQAGEKWADLTAGNLLLVLDKIQKEAWIKPETYPQNVALNTSVKLKKIS